MAAPHRRAHCCESTAATGQARRAARRRRPRARRPRAPTAPAGRPRAAAAAAASTPHCQTSSIACASGTAAPRIAPTAAGPAPSRNARALGDCRIRTKRSPSDSHHDKRRRERDRRRQQRAAETGRGPADHRHRMDHRTGRELTVRDRVGELGIGHPPVGVHGVGLHERDDHEAAAVGEGTDLEGRPGQRGERGGGQHERGRRERRSGAGPAAPRQLGEPAAEQDEHHARADRDRRGGAPGRRTRLPGRAPRRGELPGSSVPARAPPGRPPPRPPRHHPHRRRGSRPAASPTARARRSPAGSPVPAG